MDGEMTVKIQVWTFPVICMDLELVDWKSGILPSMTGAICGKSTQKACKDRSCQSTDMQRLLGAAQSTRGTQRLTTGPGGGADVIGLGMRT